MLEAHDARTGTGDTERLPEASGLRRHRTRRLDSRRRPRSQRRALTVGWTAIVVAGFVASLLTLPVPEDPGPPDVARLAEHLEARHRTDLFSSRPAYLPEPPGPMSTASPPSPLIDPALVSKAIIWDDAHVPYLVPDTALPIRYVVDERLAERFGLEAIVSAMEQWDGIPGSRWATQFEGVTSTPRRRPRSDGTSLVFMRDDCPANFLGGAFWNSAPGPAHLESRYGTAALFSSQIDIAICGNVRSIGNMRAVVAHEVGHMMGMAHLCEPGEICWQPGLDDSDRRCRVMHYRFGPCRTGVEEREYAAARHLYPTLPRLFGSGVEETAARASYATTWTHTANTVVLAPVGASAYTGPLAVALAGTHDAPLLLAEPDEEACVSGAVADELSRAADNPATVLLVGSWPESCEDALAPWDLRVEHVDAEVGDDVPAGTTPALSVRLAEAVTAARDERGELPESALLVVADGGGPSHFDAASAAAVAGHRGVPLLLTEPGGLSEHVGRWLAQHPTVRRVQVVGELEAISHEILDDLVELGLFVVRVPGGDPVERAVRLAERERPFGTGADGEDAVVIAPDDSLHDAVVGAGVAARVNAPLLLSGGEVDDLVEDWLEQRAPRGGFLVGHPERLPYPLQWAYTAHVLATDEPAPSRGDAPGLGLGRPLTGQNAPLAPQLAPGP